MLNTSGWPETDGVDWKSCWKVGKKPGKNRRYNGLSSPLIAGWVVDDGGLGRWCWSPETGRGRTGPDFGRRSWHPLLLLSPLLLRRGFSAFCFPSPLLRSEIFREGKGVYIQEVGLRRRLLHVYLNPGSRSGKDGGDQVINSPSLHLFYILLLNLLFFLSSTLRTYCWSLFHHLKTRRDRTI